MWDPSYEPRPGPPTDRLWDDDDVAAFTGFRSIDELIARHRDFPAPVPFQMHGRRWRPVDIIRWVDHLCERGLAAPQAPAHAAIPPLDLTTIPDLAATRGARGEDRA